MEKEQSFLLNENDRGGIPAWKSSMLGMEIPPCELNCSSEQLSVCFFGSNWDPSIDQNDPFESALSSIVSSPVASNAVVGAGDGLVIRELFGRLGSISNLGEISPQPRNIGSSNAPCYSTPLSSPPKLNLCPVVDGKIRGNSQFSSSYLPSSHPSLAPLNAVEGAATFSSFGGRNLAGLGAQFWPEFGCGSLPKLETGKLSPVLSNQSIKVAGLQMGARENVNSLASDGKLGRIPPESGEIGGSREGSSVSELNPGGQLGVRAQNDANSRKRKVKTKAKEPAKEEKIGRQNNESPNAKRIKQDEDAKKDNADNLKTNENCKSTGDGGEKHNNCNESAKPPEPPKDYIHVRARRGQATDSHSLAERVRREKISERMKFLQDLVPGCNKVTGKAVILDEIINYVQSLQRQVEFLSMKLATVNPQMEFNVEALLSKEVSHSRGLFLSTMYPLDTTTAQAFPYSYQSQQITSLPNGVYSDCGNPSSSMTPPNNSFHKNPSIQMPSTDGFSDSAAEVPTFGGDDLHSIIQMGFPPKNKTGNYEGTKPATQVKVEL